jgi:predicted ATPase
VLIIEDLHWADSGSLDLLFRLSRRLESSRLMIIGTYRPHEVNTSLSDEGISLAKITDELKRYRGDIVLDLNRTDVASRRAFVDAYLDREPNRLDAEFRRKLYNHTQGHPLFTVELLRDFQERGILAKDAQGRWVIVHSPDWDHLPARVEGVIAGRIRSLEDELRQDLTTASVEGVEFTAEVIAMLNKTDVRQQVQHLSGTLQKTYQLVEGQEVRRVGQQRISRYRFAHHLFQRYLYSSLDPVEASYLHEAVGTTLEALYADQADEIAAQLAHHFERAESPEKAIRYLRIAAEQAAAIYANQTALDYVQRGLTLVSPEQDADRFTQLAIRERIYDLMGQRDLQRADLAELTKLAEKLPDRQHKSAEIALRRSKLALDVSDYTTAIQEARSLIDLMHPRSAASNSNTPNKSPESRDI